MSGRIEDPDGRPLAGVAMRGLDGMYGWGSLQLDTPEFTVLGLDVRRDRELVFEYRTKRWAAYKVIPGDEEGPLVVRLEPCGVVIGRVVDQQGLPQAGIRVVVRRRASYLNEFEILNDDKGRFLLDAIVPGLPYQLFVALPKSPQLITVRDDLRLDAAATEDLGEILLAEGRAPNAGTTAPPPKPATPDKQPDRPKGEPPASKPTADKAQPEDMAIVRGRVLDPNGKPVAGARLFLTYPNLKVLAPVPLGASGDDGRFELRVDKSQLDKSYMSDPWSMASISAAADGFGGEWLAVDKADEHGDLTIRLVPDLAIEGRILSLEGKPIAGAKVSVRQIRVPEKNLDAYVEAAQRGSFQFAHSWTSLPGTPVEVLTDAEGRFTLHGLGAERVIELSVESKGIANSIFLVMTRASEPLLPLATAGPAFGITAATVYGAKFDYLAAPSRTMVGTVRDEATGEPIAGVRIRGFILAEAKSGDDGRFTLHGVAKGKMYQVDVLPEGLPYFGTSVQLADTPGFEPLTADFKLHRGIVARGRVTAGPAGDPNPAAVEYYPLAPNPHVARLGPEVRGRARASAACDADGTYTIPVLPGPGVLAFRAGPLPGGPNSYAFYSAAYVSRQELQEFFADDKDHGDDETLHVENGAPLPSEIRQIAYNKLALINPGEDADSLVRDVTFEVGRTVAGTVQDPEGGPLTGVKVRGLSNAATMSQTLDSPQFTVTALDAHRQRELIFEYPEKQWALYKVLKPDERGPLTLRLEPCGSVTGRLLDPDGDPVAGTDVSFARPRSFPAEFSVRADRDGRFRAEGLVPGRKYDLMLPRPQGGFGGMNFVMQGLSVAAGEVKDLGELRVKPPAMMRGQLQRPAAAPRPGKPTGKDAVPPKAQNKNGDRPGGKGFGIRDSGFREETNGNSRNDAGQAENVVTLRGRVLDQEGKPVAGAKLFFTYPNLKQLGFEPIAASDDGGRFAFQVDRSQFDRSYTADPWPQALVTAAADGLGCEWVEATRFTEAPSVELRLAPAFPIHGRILTLEGRPVVGAAIKLGVVRVPAGKNLDSYIEALRSGRLLNYAFQRTAFGMTIRETTDADGRFTLRAVAAERLAGLTLEGPGIESQQLQVMTRDCETVVLAKSTAMRPGGQGDKAFGATFESLAPPGRTIAGTVRDRETGQPIAGVKVLGTQTDAQGRFEVLGRPKDPKPPMLPAVAVPEGPPYLVDSRKVPDTPGLGPITIDFELARGVPARGRVTLAATGEPVRARVEYYPLKPNPHAERLKLGPLQQGYFPARAVATTDEDGRYTIAVLPGPGALGFRTLDSDKQRLYVRGFVSDDDAQKLLPQLPGRLGEAFQVEAASAVHPGNFNAFVLINPADDATSVAVDEAVFEVGRSVKGTLLRPDGTPAIGVSARGLSDNSFHVDKLATNEFTVVALSAGRSRELIFDDRDHGWGARTVIAGDEAGPLVVRLAPYGALTGRVLDADGEVLAQAPVSLHLGRIANDEFSALTDEHGKFRFDSLVPGLQYYLMVRSPIRGGTPFERASIVVAPGETKDLGDIELNVPR